MLNTDFLNQGFLSKVFILFFIVALSSIVFTSFGMLISFLFFGTEITFETNISQQEALALKIVQVFSTLGFFLIPAFIFRFIDTTNKNFFKLNNLVKPTTALLCVLLFVSLIPIVNLLININAQISFPEEFIQIEQWFKEQQTKQEQIIKKFTLMNTQGDLLLNIFVMALVPAFSEELFFRGVLQNLVLEWKKNIHFAVFLTAFLFAVVHQQFYTFIPIFFLGAILGYIYCLTANIWLPITIHFLNNFLAVLSSYFEQQDKRLNLTENLTAHQENTAWLLQSMLASGLILYFLYKKRTNLNLQ